jgi:hypothetical protein
MAASLPFCQLAEALAGINRVAVRRCEEGKDPGSWELDHAASYVQQ